MPMKMQTRLLRVIAEGEFHRVGDYDSINVDVRIIAATHQQLEALVRKGKFREDLFHRLNVIRVHVPGLADRREDIPLLAAHFMERATREIGEEAKQFDAETLNYLSNLPWPGNVRQLENTCRWLAVMVTGRRVLIDDLPPELKGETAEPRALSWEAALADWVAAALVSNRSRPILHEALPAFERAVIVTALKHTGGRRKEAAERLGWGRNTLTRKISELDL